MIFIGERINTGFKDIKQAVTDKDKGPLQEWAKRQADAGASFLDVNLGAVSSDPADMCWMIETVQEAAETNICIDTNKPDILTLAHPRSITLMQEAIDQLMTNGKESSG